MSNRGGSSGHARQTQAGSSRLRHQWSSEDGVEALAPVEVSGGSSSSSSGGGQSTLEAPTYVSPHGSRGSVRGREEAEEGPSSGVRNRGAAAAAPTEKQQQQTAVQLMDRRPVHERQVEETPQGSRCCEILLLILSGLLIVLTFPFSLCACIKIVQQYERAVIFRLGRVQGPPKGPGLFFIVLCVDKMQVVDLRTITFDVPPQEILTKDSVTVAVDAVVYYRIFDPIKAVVGIEDVHRATRLLAQTCLRNILGTKTLHEILGEREEIAHSMQSNLDVATDPWGVQVERVEVKDVRLPVQMQRAMAAEAEALREARAKVIAAEGEQKASRALKEAADVINESPAALQLRYLQTLNTIAAEKNSTIVFPLPMELLKSIGSR